MRWGDTWSVDGVVTARNINAAVFAPALVSDGRAEGSGRFSMRGAEPAKLGEAARIDGNFTSNRGVLGSFDLARARADRRQGGDRPHAVRRDDRPGRLRPRRGRAAQRHHRRGRSSTPARAPTSRRTARSPGRIVADVQDRVAADLRATLNPRRHGAGAPGQELVPHVLQLRGPRALSEFRLAKLLASLQKARPRRALASPPSCAISSRPTRELDAAERSAARAAARRRLAAAAAGRRRRCTWWCRASAPSRRGRRRRPTSRATAAWPACSASSAAPPSTSIRTKPAIVGALLHDRMTETVLRSFDEAATAVRARAAAAAAVACRSTCCERRTASSAWR